MLGRIGLGFALGTSAIVMMSLPVSARSLEVHVDHLRNGGTIPTTYSFCAPAAQGHAGPGPDINPRISWSGGPRGTKSYAILLSDTDSPAEHREMMNKEGMSLTAAVKRKTFYHWVLVDIPANVTSIAEGAVSKGSVPHGRPAMPSPVGTAGMNDYTVAFAANDAMKGDYFGYDGPCPPWNDENVITTISRSMR